MREQQPKDNQKCDLVLVDNLGNRESRTGYTYRAEADGWFKPFFEPGPRGSARLTGQTFVERTSFSGKINPDLIEWTPA